MPFFRIAGAAVFALLVLSAGAGAALAQTAPVSQVIVTTQLAAGVAAPSAWPTVTVQANGPSFATVPASGTTTLSYTSSFLNDVHTITFVPGNYLVTVSALGQYVTYSQDCAGTTAVGALVRNCTVTLTNTPPAAACSGYGCAPLFTPYVGPILPSRLSCSPAYQTVAAGQPATFAAAGGTTGAYNWTTADRTFLNVGSPLSVVLQGVGMQTVIVSAGVQTATCIVTVTDGNKVAVQTGSIAPLSLSSTYIPALLPNTGFEPLSGASLAFAAALLLSAGILLYPYVRKALIIATR